MFKLFKTKRKYDVVVNACDVTCIRKGSAVSYISRPGPNIRLSIKMDKNKANDFFHYSKALKEQHSIDTYYYDVLSIKDATTQEIIFEKNIRKYYFDLPEEEFVKRGL